MDDKKNQNPAAENAASAPGACQQKNGRPNVASVLDVTVDKMRAMADADTIIGEQIVLPDGIVMIPVSRVNYGFASGGSDFASKNAPHALFGGGGGGGMTITPVAFIVVKNGEVELLNVAPSEVSMGVAERAVAVAPELFDKIRDLFKKDKKAED